MNPCRTKDLYSKIADKLFIDLDIIKTINSFYWKTVRSHLTELTYLNVNLIGLGNMEIKTWEFDSKIKDLEYKTKKWKEKDSTGPIYKVYENDLVKILNLKDLHNKEKQREKEFRLKRKLYDVEKCNKNLEK